MTAAAVLVPALCCAAVVVWPGRDQASRRVTRLIRPPAGRGDDGRAEVTAKYRAARRALPADLVMELVACALRAGLPVSDALAAGSAGAQSGYLDAVVSRLRLGVPARSAWARPPPEYDGLARAMVVADLSGAPAAAVVARAAADLRAARRERAELAAARLGVRLVLPLGLAVLPGFVLLAVVPLVLGLASGLSVPP